MSVDCDCWPTLFVCNSATCFNRICLYRFSVMKLVACISTVTPEVNRVKVSVFLVLKAEVHFFGAIIAEPYCIRALAIIGILDYEFPRPWLPVFISVVDPSKSPKFITFLITIIRSPCVRLIHFLPMEIRRNLALLQERT